MKKVSLKEREQCWMYQRAAFTFQRAHSIACALRDVELRRDRERSYPLIIALYVLYGRPFKQRKSVRIPEDLVPTEFTRCHATMITLRDKI